MGIKKASVSSMKRRKHILPRYHSFWHGSPCPLPASALSGESASLVTVRIPVRTYARFNPAAQGPVTHFRPRCLAPPGSSLKLRGKTFSLSSHLLFDLLLHTIPHLPDFVKYQFTTKNHGIFPCICRMLRVYCKRYIVIYRKDSIFYGSYRFGAAAASSGHF